MIVALLLYWRPINHCKVVIYNYVLCYLFHDKKCCNCINLFPCILWDFIVLDLVLSWWRIKLAMKISAVSRLPHKNLANKSSHKKATWEAYVGIKCQVVFREYFARKAISRGTHKTLRLEDFKCDFLTLHPYYIYPYYPQK